MSEEGNGEFGRGVADVLEAGVLAVGEDALEEVGANCRLSVRGWRSKGMEEGTSSRPDGDGRREERLAPVETQWTALALESVEEGRPGWLRCTGDSCC